MATAIARPPASRRLRSRINWPTSEGPTPRPAGAADSGVSIGSSLLGFYDLGTEVNEEVAVRGIGRPLRLRGLERVRNLVGFEQQILALRGRGGIREVPEIALGARNIAVREPHHREAAALPAVLFRVEPLSLFVGAQRLGVLAREKQRVPEVVVPEHERR